MILRGCVRGAIYPVQERVYEEPLDGTRRCSYCGKKFVYDPAVRLKAYCSHECKRQMRMKQTKATYDRNKWRKQ